MRNIPVPVYGGGRAAGHWMKGLANLGERLFCKQLQRLRQHAADNREESFAKHAQSSRECDSAATLRSITPTVPSTIAWEGVSTDDTIEATIASGEPTFMSRLAGIEEPSRTEAGRMVLKPASIASFGRGHQ